MYLFRHVLTLLLCVLLGGNVLVLLNSWLGRSVPLRDAFTRLLITGFSWHGKKKEEPTDLEVGP